MTGKERVEQILSQTPNFASINSTANIEVLSYLSNLADFLRDQEQTFYDALGVKDIRGLNQLLDRIDKQSNLTALNAGGAIYRFIESNYTFKDSSKKGEIGLKEENIFNLFTELLSSISAERFLDRYMNEYEKDAIYDGLMDALTEIFSGITINGGYIKYIFTAHGSRSSTGYYKKNKEVIGNATIKINLNQAIRKGKVEIVDDRFIVSGDPAEFVPAVEKEIKERIRPELMRRLNKTYTDKAPLELMSPNEIRDLVNNIITTNFGIQLDPTDLAAAKNIAIGAGAGNISGYLGELQSRLYFRSLFTNVKDASIIEAGASYIKSMSGATQMDPADTIIKIANQLFNIQVKNYAKGGAEWGGAGIKINAENLSGASTAASFITERLQVNAPFLFEFFGAATWHNLNPKYSNDPSYPDYAATYSEFQGIFGSLKESFDTFIPNIIRLTAIIDGSDLQYENFYFSKGRMIPASAIIDGIQDALFDAPSKKIFTSSYGMTPGASHYTYQQPYISSYAGFAKETGITWRISMNFNKVLASIGL